MYSVIKDTSVEFIKYAVFTCAPSLSVLSDYTKIYTKSRLTSNRFEYGQYYQP